MFAFADIGETVEPFQLLRCGYGMVERSVGDCAERAVTY